MRQMPDDADSKLDGYLADWERTSYKIRRLDCEFQRFVYDTIFEVEKRGQGTINVERCGRARYRRVPADLKPGDASKRLSKAGGPYELQAYTAECWQWTGSELFKFDDQEHTYEKIDVQASRESGKFSFFQITEQGTELLFLKPFLLGMPADQLKKRFNVFLWKETDDRLWLELIPRGGEYSDMFEKAMIMLDRRTWLTQALKLWDPTGAQTVHIFQNIKVNSDNADDLSKPNVEGYRQIVSGKPSEKGE
jgi:hypothetical protein